MAKNGFYQPYRSLRSLNKQTVNVVVYTRKWDSTIKYTGGVVLQMQLGQFIAAFYLYWCFLPNLDGYGRKNVAATAKEKFDWLAVASTFYGRQ